jgi:hypothetical protein
MSLLVFPGPAAFPFRAALVLMYGLQPQVSFLAAAVHPDNFALLLGSLVMVMLLLLAKRVKVPGTALSWFGPLVLTLGLAVLSGKITRKLLILAPFLGTALPVIFWPRLRKSGTLEGLARLAWGILAVAFLIATALYLFPSNLGDRLHWSPLISPTDKTLPVSQWSGWLRYAVILFTTFWMALGSLVHKLSLTWLVMLAAAAGCSCWGWLSCVRRNDRWHQWSGLVAPQPLVLLGIWLAWVLVSVVVAYGHPAAHVEGRYLLAALPSIAVLWIVGLALAGQKDSSRNPLRLWIPASLLLNFVVLFEYLIPIYYLPG